MDVFECIKKRRSIRSFKKIPIKYEDLMKILNAAILAPSAGNIQPWEFIIVTRQDLKEELAEAALGQYWMLDASVIIVVCAREKDSASRYGSRGKSLYCIQDTAAAIENMLLAITALGYGACWVGAFDEDAVRKILKIPLGVRPIALIPIGVPNESPEPRWRKELHEVLHFEFYGGSKEQV
ncbi:MAG: nitroreductase family protein [Candidatus Methanomethylicaceae archaeon]|nr:nitroreductase family protein [Candidatus Verstraetearchaeota archaeon]